MALSTYTELNASVADWLNRTDLTAAIADFISLGVVVPEPGDSSCFVSVKESCFHILKVDQVALAHPSS